MRKHRSTSLSTATMIGGSTSYFSTPPVEAGGIALVQYSAATTADGSAAAVAQVLTNTIDVPTTITGGDTAIVSGAAFGNGTYTARGTNGGKPYYNLAGQVDSLTIDAIVWDDGPNRWYIYNGDGNLIYRSDDAVAYPWLVTSWQLGGEGANPLPTVTGSGNVNLTVYAAGFNGGVPLVVPCALTSGFVPADVASEISNTLNVNSTFASFFSLSGNDPADGDCTVYFLAPNFNDPTAYFTVTPTTATGINASTSTITTDGALAGCSAQMPGSMIVTGIGAGEYIDNELNAGGFISYTLSGQSNGGDPSIWGLFYSGGDDFWHITDGVGIDLNISTTTGDVLPSQSSWTGSTVTASNITAGNQVLVGVSYATSAMDSATFVGGGALTLVPDSQVTNAGIRTAWYRGTAVGGETGVQFTTDSAVRISIQAMEFSGVSGGAAEDTDTALGTSDAVILPNLTPSSAANLLLILGAYDDSQFSAMAAGFTRLGTGTGGASIWQDAGYLIQSAATPQNNMTIALGDVVTWAASGIALGAA